MTFDAAIRAVFRVCLLVVFAVWPFSAQITPQPPSRPPQAVSAQGSPPSSTTPLRPDQLGSIAGKVVDSQSGTPLTTGWVMASKRGGGSETFGARVQADGIYKIHRLEPGTYILRMTAAGFASAPYRPNREEGAGVTLGTMGGAPITVTAGNATTGIDFRAFRNATIFGRVTDENGQPMVQVQVRASAGIEFNRTVQMVPRSAGITDDRGEYRLSNLEPGEYEISVEAGTGMRMGNVIDRSDPDRDLPMQTYETAYYPGVTDRSQATRVRVGPAEEKFGIDFLLRPSGGYSVSGVILGSDGKPCLQCVLVITRKSDDDAASFLMPLAMTGTNPRDGTFVRASLSDGVYQITGGSRGTDEPGFLSGEFAVAGADVKDLRFALRPGVTISGTLRLDGTPRNPPADGPSQNYVFLQPKNNQQMMSFRGGGFSRNSQRDGMVDEKGQFRFDETPPLSYHVRARLRAGYYLSQVLHGGQDVSASGLDLTEASGEVTVRLIARGDGGQVQGKAVSDDGVAQPGAQVRLVPVGANEDREDFARTSVADQVGSFTLDSIAPGDYVVFALPNSGVPLAAKSPRMQQLVQRGQRITVKPISTHRVDVKVIKPDAPR